MQPIMDFRAGFRDINYAHKVQKKRVAYRPGIRQTGTALEREAPQQICCFKVNAEYKVN
jgi:hypothetical protein